LLGLCDGLPQKRWWRAFTEHGNGIMGDMRVHMLDTALCSSSAG
jgi:predicted dehydrogenase